MNKLILYKTIVIVSIVIGITIGLTIETIETNRRKTALALECIKQGMNWTNWNSECKK